VLKAGKMMRTHIRGKKAYGHEVERGKNTPQPAKEENGSSFKTDESD